MSDDAIKQSAQQRAMFANMGGGGGGGGGGKGGGGKPTGGTGGLWKVNPETGQREPGQGLEKGAKPSAGQREAAAKPRGGGEKPLSMMTPTERTERLRRARETDDAVMAQGRTERRAAIRDQIMRDQARTDHPTPGGAPQRSKPLSSMTPAERANRLDEARRGNDAVNATRRAEQRGQTREQILRDQARADHPTPAAAPRAAKPPTRAELQKMQEAQRNEAFRAAGKDRDAVFTRERFVLPHDPQSSATDRRTAVNQLASLKPAELARFRDSTDTYWTVMSTGSGGDRFDRSGRRDSRATRDFQLSLIRDAQALQRSRGTKGSDMDLSADELKYSRRHSAIDEDAMARGMQYLKAARLAFVEAGAPDEDSDGLPDMKSIPEIADDAHPGAMVCLVVPDEIQELLDGDTPDHVTICYLGGDAATLEDNKTDIIAALARVALHGSPIEGYLGGVARFNASESTDGRDVLVALVDSPDLPLLHAAVSEALDDCDIDLPADHGFIPHITLEYLDPDERMPRLTIPREPVTFDALTIVWAGERIDLPFGDEDEADAPKMPMYIGAVKADEEIDLAPVGAIKALGDYALAVRGIVYGGEDLVGDAFIKATDLGFGRDPTGMPVYYDHARSGLKSQIGHVTAWKADDEGILFDVELDKRHQYAAMVMGLARKGALGGSTGALSHLVIRRDGELKRWIVGELSLTPTPAEPRSIAATKATDPEAMPPAAIDETPEADTEAVKAADVSGALLAHTLTTIAARQIARRYQ